MMKRVLTALQPSGVLHIGNYFGAIEPMVRLQGGGNPPSPIGLRRASENLLFIVDYHAITVPQDPEELRRNILFATATYLASGIDPTRTILFQQSHVPEHTELAWILNSITYMGELERMTQFKEKAGRAGRAGRATGVSVGLFDYPVLMAADILLYDTHVVPVGEDQKQHVELARDIALRFNKRFGETFVVPKVQIREQGARIMGLDDPKKKMSKSASSEKNYLSIMDNKKTVLQKIKAAVTDSGTTIAYDEARPGLANLLTIYSLVTGKSISEIATMYRGKGYGEFKLDLADVVSVFLSPLQEKIKAYLDDQDELLNILRDGAKRATDIAAKKMEVVRQKIGVQLP